jgi:nicotinamidase-related amidase
MLKAIAAIGPEVKASDEIISILNFNNEASAIDRVLKVIPDNKSARLSFSKKYYLRKNQISAYFALFKATPNYWSFIRKIARTYDFMPACRMASVLAFYIRFDETFKKHENLKTALIASNYSPECTALAAAAHKNGRKVIYVNHAPVPANSAYVPPVLSDYSVFYGTAMQDIYQRRSRCMSQVVTIGQPGDTQFMKWLPQIKTVGIFLTALTQKAKLEALIEQIKHTSPKIEILIRHHPVSLLETNLEAILERYDGIRTTIGTPLDKDIADCDLVFSGNSGVAMNVLRGGKPVAYLATLDSLPHDYLGFVTDGLACEVSRWHDDLYQELRAFYDRDIWKDKMREYDASFGVSRTKLMANLEKKLSDWIK